MKNRRWMPFVVAGCVALGVAASGARLYGFWHPIPNPQLPADWREPQHPPEPPGGWDVSGGYTDLDGDGEWDESYYVEPACDPPCIRTWDTDGDGDVDIRVHY